jgi:hypothetical protein
MINPVLLQKQTYSIRNMIVEQEQHEREVKQKEIADAKELAYRLTLRRISMLKASSNDNNGDPKNKSSVPPTPKGGGGTTPKGMTSMMSEVTVASMRQKSVKIHLDGKEFHPTDAEATARSLLSRQRSASGDEFGLSYIGEEEFRNSMFDYNFEPSRPPSQGNSNLSGNNNLSRQNTRIRSNSFEYDDGSVNSSSNNSYRRSSPSKAMASLDGLSKAEVYENLSNKHFLIRRYSSFNAGSILDLNNNSPNSGSPIVSKSRKDPSGLQHQSSAYLSTKNNNNNNNNNPMKKQGSTVSSAADFLPDEKNVTAVVKDPALENPNKFYLEYKSFENKMQEEKQKHLSYYNLITTNFDRRISLARSRLHQMKNS